jgi:hypothetical protein
MRGVRAKRAFLVYGDSPNVYGDQLRPQVDVDSKDASLNRCSDKVGACEVYAPADGVLNACIPDSRRGLLFPYPTCSKFFLV